MGVDTTEQREAEEADATSKNTRTSTEDARASVRPARANLVEQARSSLRDGFSQFQWGPVLLFGSLAGLLMTFSLLQSGALTVVAGIVPVGTGLILARRVKGYYGLHGFIAGLVGGIVVLIGIGVLLFTPLRALISTQNLTGAAGPTSIAQLWITTGSFLAFSLITFCTFGATMAGRSEERNRAMREQVEERGGQLERPSAVRVADDIRGFSLPQFGWYVNNLFKKKGFQFKDYRFIDKDKHLDLWLEYEGEPWHLRLTVVDKVSPGTVESLAQEMKREGTRKGVVLTSTEFLPSAVKSAKGRPIVLIDGETLYKIAEQ